MALNVPYLPQADDNTCGAACLRMVLDFYGKQKTESSLALASRTGYRGTTAGNLVEVAEELGLKAVLISPETALTQLEEALQENKPVVALVSGMLLTGSLSGHAHFVVVTDATDELIQFHDPEHGPDRRVDRAHFLMSWAYYEFRGLVVWT